MEEEETLIKKKKKICWKSCMNALLSFPVLPEIRRVSFHRQIFSKLRFGTIEIEQERGRGRRGCVRCDA